MVPIPTGRASGPGSQALCRRDAPSSTRLEAWWFVCLQGVSIIEGVLGREGPGHPLLSMTMRLDLLGRNDDIPGAP